MKAFLWLVFDTASIITDIINYTLLSFLLWEGEQSISLILEFNLLVFAGLLVSSLVSGILQQIFGAKLMFMAGMFMQAGIAFFAFSHSSDLASQIVIISIAYGFANALIQNAKGVLTLGIIPTNQSVSYSSRKEIVMSLGSIAIPLVTKVLIDSFGYEQSFTFTAAIFAMIGVLTVILKSKAPVPQRFIFPKLLIKSITTKSIRNIGVVYIALGISGVYGWGLLNIIILDVLGSLEGWTNVSTALALAGIGIAMALRRVNTKDRAQSKSIIVLGALIYAAIPIMLLANFSVELFIAFTFAKLLYDKSNFIVTYNYLSQIEHRDPDFESHKLAFQIYNSFFMAIGRMIPVGLLLLLPTMNLSIEVLILGFSIVALAPLAVSKAFDHEFQGGHLD